MTEAFDPYLKWLGIPPKHQPPNDYRLLGIEPFEADPDVIANAADQRMAHLKNFAAGKHSRLSQKILNEIAAARVRLLNPQEKAKYDAGLRKQVARTRPAPPKLRTASPLPEPQPEVRPVISADPQRSAAGRARRESGGSDQRPRPWLLPAAVGGGVVVTGVLLALVLILGPDRTKVSQAENRAARSERDGPGPSQSRPSAEGPKPGESEPSDVPPAEPSDPQPTHPPPTDPQTPEPIGPQPPEREPTGPQPPEPEPPPAEPEPTGLEATGPDQPSGDPSNLGPAPPEPAEPQPGDPQPPEDAPATSQPAEPVKKLAEPDEEAQRTTIREVREIYQQELEVAETKAEKRALAERLSRDGLATKDNPVARFVLLQMAADLAAEAEEIDAAFDSIDRIDELYTVDAFARKADVLATVSRGVVRRPAAMLAAQQIVLHCQKLTEEALSAADVKAADRFVKIAMPAARKLRDRQLIAVLQNSSKDLERLEDRYESVEKAVAVLESNPGDPRANLAAGSWYCFIAGDWQRGLPWLAKGDDPQLADLAKRDLAQPQSAEQQAALGDAWWELSESKKGLENSRLRGRAAHWYGRALPKLTGLARAKLEKRIEETGLTVGRYALKFDGQKSHVIIHNFGYPGPSPITVEAVVKPAAAVPVRGIRRPRTSSEQVVLSNMRDAGLALSNYAGYWTFKFYYSYKLSSSSRYVYSRLSQCRGTRSTTGEKWTHLAGVYDGSQIRLFVDGQLQNSYAISHIHTHKASPFPFVLGAAPTPAAAPNAVPVANFFQGLIRGVRISNAALYTHNFRPPQELEAKGGTTVLLFQCNEGRGDRLKDAVGRKAYGEIKDAEWVRLD